MSTVHTNSSERIFLDYYSRLNPAQKEAVDTVLGPVMVIAGPGTGKTQILAMRIANILRNPDLQANPSNILCLTFTESAVTAMRNRLIEIMGSEAYYVRIHTFHSFCNDVIKENPAKFLTINSISDLEQIQILNSIIDTLDPNSAIKPFGDQYLYRGDIAKHIQTLKREFISPGGLRESIRAIEHFIHKNKDLIEDFISRHARTIKEEDCDLFIEKLFVANQESPFITLIQEFRDIAEKIAEFKSMVKDFYEKNLREIPKQKELAKVYEAYEEKLKTNKLYDFEDMILRVIKQFENDADLRARYQEQFQYILVDEYQDTNGSQNKILELLTFDPYGQNYPNIFVVGDDDQSIYRFQGASLENIIYFYKRYQTNLKLIVLDQNYRSQQRILNLAHLSIDANSARISKLIPNISKQLKSSGSAADYHLAEIEILKSINHEDEVYNLAKTVQSLIESGVKPSEIAILFRENKEAYNIAEALARLGIRAKLEAGDNILEDIQIAQLIDLLRVISKPESYSSLLFNVLNYDFILESEDFKLAGITMQDVYSVASLRFGSADPKPIIELLLEHPKFSSWAQKIIKAKQESYNVKFDDLLEKIIKNFGFLDFCLKQSDYITRINKLNSLFKEISTFKQSPLREGYNPSLAIKFNLDDFIKHIELLQENNLKIRSQPISLTENAVRLMTAHKSKGLEFEHVFIHACRDKHWGNKINRSKIKLPPRLLVETESLVCGDANEDERRLFYVAMTRAKHKLYISYHIKNTRDQDIVPSLFLSELINNPEVKIIDFTQGFGLGLESSAKLETMFLSRDDFFINKESEYIDGLLENYRMSITHLNNYLECPRKFFYQNLLRVPSAKNKHSCFGTAVHEALFDLFTMLRINFGVSQPHANVIRRSEAACPELLEDGLPRRLHYVSSARDDDTHYLLERFEHHLQEENLPEQDFQDALGVGKQVLSKYYNQYANSFNLNTELEFDFSSLGVNLDGIALTGKLDKIEKLDNAQINVIDYKTGNPSSKAEALRPGGDYYRQIVFYQLLCNLANKSGQFPYRMVSGEIDFVQEDSYGKFHKKKFQVSEEDLTQLKTEIQTMYSAVRAHKFDKTEDLDSCKNCSFKNICGR